MLCYMVQAWTGSEWLDVPPVWGEYADQAWRVAAWREACSVRIRLPGACCWYTG